MNSAPSLRDAYTHCGRVARASRSSFLAAFWLFPRAQRQALHAIYAFCRMADDIADDDSVRGDRLLLLARWHRVLDEAYLGKSEHPVGIALADTVARFELSKRWFEDLLTGIEADLFGAPIERFADLERYCYCVASTIGLLVVGVRGLHGDAIRDYAIHMGIGVQLTNVLRDVGEDAAHGRIYLAREDLERMQVAPESLRAAARSEAHRLLFALYAERARIRFERAEAAPLSLEQRRRLRPVEALGAIYRDLLDTLQARGFPCLEPSLRLSRARRVAIAARAWLAPGAVA
ncbi:MAG TPA: squalene/phytoene synthase family protein [Myxococcota bacterium]|nr:squalene/phytoene synthase family protein [Myxococcota bacterium]